MPEQPSIKLKLSARIEEVVRFIDPRPARLRGLAIAFLVAGLAGWLFTILKLPLPWMLGPLFLSLSLSAMGRPLESPTFLVFPARAMVGVAIGSSFSPDLLAKGTGALFSIAMMVPFSVIITFVGVVFLHRLARFDKPTAFFSAAPGGLSDMLFFAMDAGANLRKVALIQTARLLMIVCIVPFWLQYVDGLPLGGVAPQAKGPHPFTYQDGLWIFFIAAVGWWLGALIGLKGSSMIGPLLFGGVLHFFGIASVTMPSEVLVFVQVTVGIVIGVTFLGITIREFTTILCWGFVLSAFLVISAAVWALLAQPITGLDPTLLLLSYVPGGQVEMAILGIILGLDVAILTTHHIVRVSLIIVGAQLVMRMHPSWTENKTRSQPES